MGVGAAKPEVIDRLMVSLAAGRGFGSRQCVSFSHEVFVENALVHRE